jgi:hypothetical protein
LKTKSLCTLAYARILFLVLFPFSNLTFLDPQGTPIPRLFPIYLNDTSYFLLLFLFALSNGLISTVLLTQASFKVLQEPVNAEQQQPLLQKAGDWMVFGLGLGLSMGSLMSFAVRSLLCGC